MLSIINCLYKALLDLVFPPHCIDCNLAGHWLCESCIRKITKKSEWLCFVCDRRMASYAICDHCRSRVPLEGVLIVGKLDGVLRDAIHKFKYEYMEVLAQPLAELLEKRIRQDDFFHDLVSGDEQVLLIPVPLHSNRLKERGFNQSELLARWLVDRFPEWRLDRGLIRRVDTHKQMELGKKDRMVNVRGAFKYTGDSVGNNVVFLLDDVCTSGATLMACAQELKSKGAKEVWGIVLAHGN